MKSRLFILFLLVNVSFCMGQSRWTLFWNLSRPERYWVISHPFVAMKAWEISIEARKVSDSLIKAEALDADGDGGQIDAFRHAYWMARLCNVMKASKAWRLGRAHEKGNYLQYKKRLKEDGSIPDETACSMDMWNNCAGIEIAKQYPDLSKDDLQKIIVSWILSGKMKIIKKSEVGIPLDEEDHPVITDSVSRQWTTRRILVKSDYKRVLSEEKKE